MLQNKSTAILHTDDKKLTIFLDARIRCCAIKQWFYFFFTNLIAKKLIKNLF